MTRDFRKGTPPPRRRNERRGTCAFWFLFGGVLGAFGVGIAWLKQDPPAPLAALLPAATEQSGATPAVSRPPPTTPEFNFYSLLPEEQVVLPTEPPPQPVALPPPGAARPSKPADATAATSPTAVALPTPAEAAPPAGRGDFMLQVGSFKRTADAERRKAELALLGVQTSIQSVTAADGQVYYRVRTGSYDKPAANAVQARLKQSGHDSMMMRTK